MHIEFIGLPGSGKTTLRKRLLKDLNFDGEKRCISSEEALLEVSRANAEAIFRYPLNFLPHSIALKFTQKLVNRTRMQYLAQNQFIANHGAALAAFLNSETYLKMSGLDKQRVIGSFLSTGAIWQCTNDPSMEDRIIFFEEGLVQKSFMFVDHSNSDTNDRARILQYLEGMPRTALVIFVCASEHISLLRMFGRPDGLTDRLKNVDPEIIKNFLRASQQHLEIVTEWLTTNRKDNFIKINTEFNNEEEFNELKNKILQL